MKSARVEESIAFHVPYENKCVCVLRYVKNLAYVTKLTCLFELKPWAVSEPSQVVLVPIPNKTVIYIYIFF